MSAVTDFLTPRSTSRVDAFPPTVYGPVDPSLPRIQDMQPGPYYCGVLVCTGCGSTVAQCGCGRHDLSHFCETCPGCEAGAPQVWVDPAVAVAER